MHLTCVSHADLMLVNVLGLGLNNQIDISVYLVGTPLLQRAYDIRRMKRDQLGHNNACMLHDTHSS